MRIRLLGTGTPTPSLRRMSSGYVIETGNDVQAGQLRVVRRFVSLLATLDRLSRAQGERPASAG